MGIIATSSETTFTHSAEELYDFVTDPRNWSKTYPGSGGIEGVDTADLPLEVGDVWSEAGRLRDLDCRYTWRLVTASRPWRFEFRGGPAGPRPRTTTPAASRGSRRSPTRSRSRAPG